MRNTPHRSGSLTRRQFIYYPALAASATALTGCAVTRPKVHRVSANEKLNIAIIGTGGRGAVDTTEVSSENIDLGNVAYRTGKRLEWDAVRLEATNCPEAARCVRGVYRKGWKLA